MAKPIMTVQPDMTKSFLKDSLEKTNETKTFADSRLEYGFTWSEKVKGYRSVFPTPEEMLIGLYKWLCDQLEDGMKDLKEEWMKKDRRDHFKKFKVMINEIKNCIQLHDANAPITCDFDKFKGQNNNKEKDLNVINPYGKITCLVLYLYSMELGNPQLYAEVNRVMRDMDFTFLNELGPFIRVLNEVTSYAEHNKDDYEKIIKGEN